MLYVCGLLFDLILDNRHCTCVRVFLMCKYNVSQQTKPGEGHYVLFVIERSTPPPSLTSFPPEVIKLYKFGGWGGLSRSLRCASGCADVLLTHYIIITHNV